MLNYNPKPSYEKYYLHTKLQENRIKTVAVTMPSFFDKYSGHDVINYVNELKLTRTQQAILETICGKFH